MQLVNADITQQGDVLELVWQDRSRSRFHALWLRDNAQDAHTRSATNGQRLITLADIPPNITIDSVDVSDSSLSVRFSPCDTCCVFSAQWLGEHCYDNEEYGDIGRLPDDSIVFDSTLQLEKVSARYEDIVADKQMRRDWLQSLVSYGFARLTDGPIEEEALFKVAELIGYVRETNYGKLFEVRNQPSPENLAYTSDGLQAHTDNPYRDPVPTLQLLYCLDNSAKGGESQVVDGFNAAAQLKASNPYYFELLSRHCVKFEYRGQSDTVLRTSMPIIELRADGEMRCIRFNNRSTAAITDVPFDKMQDFYKAYRAFAELINNTAAHVQFKLNPGECFVVDNSRTLHARSAFELDQDGSGRWLQGCYVEKDGLLSSLAVLKAACNG